MDEKRKKILDSTLLQIEKQFGKGAVMRMGEEAHPGPGAQGDFGAAGGHGSAAGDNHRAAGHIAENGQVIHALKSSRRLVLREPAPFRRLPYPPYWPSL